MAHKPSLAHRTTGSSGIWQQGASATGALFLCCHRAKQQDGQVLLHTYPNPNWIIPACNQKRLPTTALVLSQNHNSWLKFSLKKASKKFTLLWSAFTEQFLNTYNSSTPKILTQLKHKHHLIYLCDLYVALLIKNLRAAYDKKTKQLIKQEHYEKKK